MALAGKVGVLVCPVVPGQMGAHPSVNLELKDAHRQASLLQYLVVKIADIEPRFPIGVIANRRSRNFCS